MRLRGTGMAIRRDVALAHRFRAPASEDLFFTLDLLLDGVRCRHVERARLRSEGASTWEAFGGQKVRYEAGRMAAARAYVPAAAAPCGPRSATRACLEAAWFLATPPFALAALSLLAGAALAALAGGVDRGVAVFGAGLLALALVIATGSSRPAPGLRTWLALLAARGTSSGRPSCSSAPSRACSGATTTTRRRAGSRTPRAQVRPSRRR